ncbi:hypothetical protein BH23VER1_BH23VER1_34560 [soil metagenome]
MALALAGAVLLLPRSLAGSEPAAAEVTFARDIAPLVFENCAGCHRPGQAAPFSLTSYDEVRRRGRLIRDVTGERFMPPWHAEPGFGEFVGERRLSYAEIAILAEWVESGMPEGDRDATPPLPVFPDGWQLGEPDVVLTMEEAFEVPASGRDIYRYFSLPLALEEDRWIRAIEVRPEARGVVHHVLFFADSSGKARELQDADSGPGFGGKGFRATAELGGWAVGRVEQFLPEGLAIPLAAGSDLVLQTHFHPSGKAESERTTVALYFADAAPEKTLFTFQVPPGYGRLAGIDVPPGEADFVIEDSFTLPVAVDLVNVWGHAHQICTSMRGTATLPDGQVIPLLSIPHWDFNWQTVYQYQVPPHLPAGTRIDARITYDNSANNPANPNHPPQRVRWGEQSFDEMGSLIFQGVAAVEDDLPRLAKAEGDQHRRAFAQATAREIGEQDFRGALAHIAESDADGDGMVSRDELKADWKDTAFRALDWNGDGQIEPGELAEGQAIADHVFTKNET